MAYTGQAVFGGTTDPVTGSWNNATTLNSTVVSSDITGYGVVAASFSVSGTVTQGTAIFEVSDDAGTTWWPISGLQTGNNNQASSYTFTGGNASFEFATGAYNLFRARLNPVVLGSGTVAVRLSAEAFPFLTAVAITGAVNVSITGTNAVTVSSGTITANQGGAPWSQNLTQVNSVALGSPSNFGTSPGAVAVIGTNASIYAGTTGLTATGSSLNVNITGGSSSGTQYTNGTAVSSGTLVGTEALGYDGTNVRAILTSATGQQHVITDSGSTTTVTGTVAVTQSTSPWVVSLTSTTITGTVAVTQSGAWTVAATQSGTWTVQQGTPPWTIQGDSASGAANAGNPVKTSAVFNTTQPTVTNGQTVDNQATARGAQIVATGVDTFNVTVNTALPAGTNVIGHVITDSGSTTVVTGTVAVTQSGAWTVAATQSGAWTVQPGNTANTTPWLTTINQGGNSATVSAAGALKVDGSAVTQPVSGTVTANQGTSPWVVSLTSTTITGTVAVTQSTSPWVANVTQFGSSNVVTGTGVSGAGIPRVTVSNDTQIRIWDGTTQAGVIATTTALKTDLSSVAGTVTVTAAAGIQKVGIVGGAGTSLETTAGVVDFNLKNVGNSAVATGTGASGTGIPRVTVSNDSKVIAWDGTNTTVVKPASTAALAADPALVVTMSPNSTPLQVNVTPTSNTFFRFGSATISGSVGVSTKIEATTYTEQSTNATRSISSSSANDSSAGTGARTVQIIYYDQTCAGPFTTTVTLNGTTAVATSVSNICFITSLQVITVGSTGSNVGILTLFVNNTGGGGTIGTVAATANQTFWAHHYVATGKTFHLTGVSMGSNSTVAGDGALFHLGSQTVPVSNQPEIQITDFLALFGQSSGYSRVYNSPVAVTGPARINMYAAPFASTSITFYGAFDFYEQ